jgi:pimeloyl-ACP methyl ester carboxylesterase
LLLCGPAAKMPPVQGTPDTRYATSGELSIAYQVVGEGDVDIVFVPGWVSHVEMQWEPNPVLGFVDGLGRIGRLVTFDKRGTGLSDRSLGAGALEDRMDDVRAVMDAAGVERASLVGLSEGGPLSILFAASYPDRVRSLVLYASFARAVSGPGYPHGVSPQDALAFVDLVPSLWGTGQVLTANAPDPPPGFDAVAAAARFERHASTPGVAAAIMRANVDIDVRDVLPAINVPTLVVHCDRDPFISVDHGRYLAAHIEGATYLEIEGDYHLSWRPERYAQALEAIAEHFTGSAHAPEPDRVLKTILFTDIVDSTPTAARLGDARWRQLLDVHDETVRREVLRFRGVEVGTTGDGFLVAFDGPARAIRCAHAIVAAVATAGLQVRAGVHAGECEVRGDDLAGMAVHIGARVASAAGADEVLVSSTVRDLVAGSGLEFEDRGEHDLKGVPGRWRLLRSLPAA